MNLIGFKSHETINEEVLRGLSDLGISITKGGIAKLFAQVINKETGDLYATLKLNHLNAFLSTAEGPPIDAIGALLNCKREGMKDDAYKIAISKQLMVLATSNKTAIELAALSVPEVEDVRLTPFSHGTGSYTLYLLLKVGADEAAVIEAVRTKVNEIEAYGVLSHIDIAESIELEVAVKLMFTATASDTDRLNAVTTAKQNIKTYINSRQIGEPFIINELTEQVMKAHQNILNYSLIMVKANGREMLKSDMNPKWNQRFVESSKPEAIKVS